MEAVAISQGHVAGGAASCVAGAYEIKESIENFKEAKNFMIKLEKQKKKKRRRNK